MDKLDEHSLSKKKHHKKYHQSSAEDQSVLQTIEHEIGDAKKKKKKSRHVEPEIEQPIKKKHKKSSHPSAKELTGSQDEDDYILNMIKKNSKKRQTTDEQPSKRKQRSNDGNDDDDAGLNVDDLVNIHQDETIQVSNLEQEIANLDHFEPDLDASAVDLDDPESDSTPHRKQALKKIQRLIKRTGLNVKPETVAFSFTNEKDIRFDRNCADRIFLNSIPLLIVNSLTKDKEVLAYRCRPERGEINSTVFRFYCNFFDDRFDRLCFQDFSTKDDAIDHYYSVHLQKKRNYLCTYNDCNRFYSFYIRYLRHLKEDHGIRRDPREYMERMTYKFNKRYSIEDILTDW